MRNKQKRQPMRTDLTPDELLVNARAFMLRQIKNMELICNGFLTMPLTGRERQSLSACVSHLSSLAQHFDKHTEELKGKEKVYKETENVTCRTAKMEN